MEVQSTQSTVKEARDDADAQAATDDAEARKKKSDIVTIPKKTALAVTSAAKPDLISDLVHGIESLEKQDAIARLIELEDAHEQTYFEIGGLLSVMQKEKMVRPLRLARRMGGEPHCDEAEQGAGSDPDLRRDRRVRGRLGPRPGHRVDQAARNRSGLGRRKRAPLDQPGVEPQQEGNH